MNSKTELGLSLAILFFVGGAVAGEPQEQQQANNNSTQKVSCRGKLSKVSTSDELYDELLPRVLTDSDTEMEAEIKKEFLKYLVLSETFSKMINCTMHEPRLLQEDGDDDDDGGQGGQGVFANAIQTLANGGPANPLDNSNVLLGVRRILANVFTGNLVGIVQESVGLRSPEGVSTVFTEVLSTLFGSTATAGSTGVIGNVTTTISPMAQLQNETDDAYYKQYLEQQQYIQQLKEQGILDQAQAIAIQHQLLSMGQQGQQAVGIVGGGVGAVQPQVQSLQQQQILPQKLSPGTLQKPQLPPQSQKQPQSPVQPHQFRQQTDEVHQYFQQSQIGSSNANGGVRRRPGIPAAAAAPASPLRNNNNRVTSIVVPIGPRVPVQQRVKQPPVNRYRPEEDNDYEDNNNPNEGDEDDD